MFVLQNEKNIVHVCNSRLLQIVDGILRVLESNGADFTDYIISELYYVWLESIIITKRIVKY